MWFNWIEERKTPETKREKHGIWVLHLLKCAIVEVKKIVLQTLFYFIKRYVTFLQGFAIFFWENFFMIAIIKNLCIIFTFNIFIYYVILVFELFFSLHLSTLYFFFLLIIDFFSALISNVVQKKKNTTTMYLFQCPKT